MLQNCNGIEPYNDSTPVEGIEFSENDILIANIRPYLKKAWKTEFSGACSTDVLSINPTAINAKFLFHCIEKDDFFNYVMSAAKGSKMPRGDKQHIMEYNIAFPSELEQEKISAFIDLLTKRITAQSKLIESLKLYKRGVITNIFNTLFDNYQKVKLSTIGTFKSGIGFKESLQGHIDLEIPFYKVSDMNSEANTITMQIANNYVSQQNPNLPVVEMDTVKGARGSHKVLLTMIFRQTNFMLVFLMPDGTQKSVKDVFDKLTLHLGLDTFRKLFPVILTDNGVEFKGSHHLEYTENGARRTRVFYCDPQASWQKGRIEKNHVILRQVLPKGFNFNTLEDEDIHLIICHVNSVVRELFENNTPFDLMQTNEQKKLLETLALSPIPLDEVCLKPKLLKRKK